MEYLLVIDTGDIGEYLICKGIFDNFNDAENAGKLAGYNYKIIEIDNNVL